MGTACKLPFYLFFFWFAFLLLLLLFPWWVFLRAKSGLSPPLPFINITTNKALALIRIPNMPEFVKISGPKQNKLREKSGKPLNLAVVEGIRGEFGMLPFPFLRTHALYFSGTLL